MDETIEFETIEFEVGDHVATITLNRPDQLNSFNETMCHEIAGRGTIVRDTDDIHVVVLRANGDRAFCTGIDIKGGMWWGDSTSGTSTDPGGYLGPRSNKVWKPVVCAVQGMCAGGGQYFVNECDIVICSDDATFFDPHANGGIVSALEPIGMLHRGVPARRGAALGADGHRGTDHRRRPRCASGWSPRWCPTATCATRAADIAAQIAARNPIAIQGTVRAIWESTDMTPHDGEAERPGLHPHRQQARCRAPRRSPGQPPADAALIRVAAPESHEPTDRGVDGSLIAGRLAGYSGLRRSIS